MIVIFMMHCEFTQPLSTELSPTMPTNFREKFESTFPIAFFPRSLYTKCLCNTVLDIAGLFWGHLNPPAISCDFELIRSHIKNLAGGSGGIFSCEMQNKALSASRRHHNDTSSLSEILESRQHSGAPTCGSAKTIGADKFRCGEIEFSSQKKIPPTLLQRRHLLFLRYVVDESL